MILIAGKHGDFVGSQNTIFKASEKVKQATERFKEKREKKLFLRDLKKNADEKNDYLDSFSLIEMLYDLNKEEKKFYNILKKV